MNKQHRLVVLVAIFASFVAFLDGAVVNVALPVMQRELGGGLAGQQWIADGYLLTLSAFILVAGSLSDVFGRLKILRYGLIGFGVSSLLCAIAPHVSVIIGARLLQGAAGALLVPSSLALLDDRLPHKYFSKAVGHWTAWTGIAFLIGPLLGGLLVDHLNWRYIFAINVVPIALTLWLMCKLRADAHQQNQPSIDIRGALYCTTALGGIVFAFIEVARLGWQSPLIWLSLGIGIVSLVAFIRRERQCQQPMLPPGLFRYGNFTAGNLATFAVYAGLGALTFIVVIFLQQVAHYSATASGLSLVPITLIMFFGSSRVGVLSERFGPRFFMTTGPLVITLGLIWLALNVSAQTNYLTEVLPGVILFGVGLTLTVTPLTAAVLGSVPHQKAGIASAVNNAIVRVAGLVAIALIGVVLATQFSASLTKQQEIASQSASAVLESQKSHPLETVVPIDPDSNPDDYQLISYALATASTQSFRTSTLVIAGIVALGGLISFVGIRNPRTIPTP